MRQRSQSTERSISPIDPLGREVVKRIDGMERSKLRAFLHLQAQTKALREAVTKAKESSIKRQVNLLNSALKDYNCVCEKAVWDSGLEGFSVPHADKAYITVFLEEGLNEYNDAMS
jgi:hypothetical protein